MQMQCEYTYRCMEIYQQPEAGMNETVLLIAWHVIGLCVAAACHALAYWLAVTI